MAVRKRKKAECVPVVPLIPAEIVSPADRQRARLANALSKRPPITADNKARLLQLMKAGEIPTDVCDDRAMPAFSAFMAECKIDHDFAAEYEDALSALADMSLMDAARFSRDSASTGNIDTMRVSDMYSKTMTSIFEKLSPRTHGVLVKHAGADAGPLQVAVINYAAPNGKE